MRVTVDIVYNAQVHSAAHAVSIVYDFTGSSMC